MVRSILGSWCSLCVVKVAAVGGISSGMLHPSKMSCSIAAIITGGALIVSGLVPWSVAMWCNPALMTSIVGSTIGCVLWKMSIGSLLRISRICKVEGMGLLEEDLDARCRRLKLHPEGLYCGWWGSVMFQYPSPSRVRSLLESTSSFFV